MNIADAERMEVYRSNLSSSFIMRGKGCGSCAGRGYTESNYRDEVRDEETYFTCPFCLTQAQRNELENHFYRIGVKRLTPRERQLLSGR